MYSDQSTRTLLRAIAVTGLVLAVTHSASAAKFIPLGDLPGGDFQSVAYDISDDGSTVVGQSASSHGPRAFRWTLSGGMVGLGDLMEGGFNSSALSVSANGSVVVGTGLSASGYEAFRWTQSEAMIGLGFLQTGAYISSSSSASGVSADGSVIVGSAGKSVAPTPEAFRWTHAGGMVGLGDPLGGTGSQAIDVSADGSVVVGQASGLAFRWTQEGGMVSLGFLRGTGSGGAAFGVSANGSIVVGFAGTPSGVEAFRWAPNPDPNMRMVGLGILPGGRSSIAYDVSADGFVVVGTSEAYSGNEAFIWDQVNGMRSLRDVLTNAGINLTGWRLYEARGVSADGSVIVGLGYNPNGDNEAWLAELNAVPEPGTAATLGLTFLAALRYTGNRRR